MSASAFKEASGFSSTVVDDDPEPVQTTAPRTTVDLAPCNFGGTLRNPCFWILVGVLGALAFQYVMAGRKGGQ